MCNERLDFVSKTKDVFLAEPISAQGRRALTNMEIAMTEEEFFSKNIYVPPFSEYEKPIVDEMVDLYNYSDVDIDKGSYQDVVDLNVLKNAKNTFENNIRKLNDALFIIKGVAGSGKTTYLHKLKYEMSNDVEYHIYNFEEVRQSNAFLYGSFDLEKLYEQNTYKFISVLLKEIFSLLGKGNLDEENHRELISQIINIYMGYFCVNEEDLSNSKLLEPNMDIMEQQELFGVLKNYADNKLTYEKFSQVLKDKFFNRFYSRETDPVSDLAYVIGFVIRLFFCFSRPVNKSQALK